MSTCPRLHEVCHPCLIRKGVIVSHTHNTELENTRTPVLNNCPIAFSNRDQFFQDSVSQFCHNEIPQNAEALFFEVFKSGSLSFNNFVCFGNMMIHRNFGIVHLRPSKKAAHMESFMNILLFTSRTGKCSNLLIYFQILSTCSE